MAPAERPVSSSPSDRIVLRLILPAKDDESDQWEFWGPNWPLDWEAALQQLAGDLEDWVCEASFAWGQQRLATVPS